MNKKLTLITLLCLFSSMSWSQQCIQGDCENGFGTRSYANGDKYTGEFKNNNIHGQGHAILVSGETYVGEWQDDKRHGRGANTWADGETYVGEWQDGNRHGHGTNTFANGETYVGEWQDGKRHGHGTDSWPSGQKYMGEWRYDLKHGIGIFFHNNGKVEEGMFINGEYQYYIAYEPEKNEKSPKEIQKENSIDDNKIVTASSGTGFSVSYTGHIITNYHVIDACQTVNVRYQGDEVSTKMLAFDAVNDLAILKADIKPSSVLPISASSPQLLQEIFVAGYPFGEDLSTSIKMTKGIVSSLTGIGNNYSNIQIDAALQPGNSGGPIFDERGNVVAVAVAKLDLKHILENYGTLPENTNFGIKSNVLLNFLESNNIADLPAPYTFKASNTELGKSVTDATYYLSCMMTMAQIKKVLARKVIYSELLN